MLLLDIPSSHVNNVQERCCAGRFDGVNPSLCSCNVNICLKSFEYRLHQTLSKHSDVLDKLYCKVMTMELMDILILLVILPKFITQELEEAMANPNLHIDSNLQSCYNCFVCKKKDTLVGRSVGQELKSYRSRY